MQLGFLSRKPLARLAEAASTLRELGLAVGGLRPSRKSAGGRDVRGSRQGAIAPWRAAWWVKSFAMKLALQLGFRPLQPVALGSRQLLAGAVDIEGQHR